MFGQLPVVESAALGMARRLVDLNDAMLDIDVEERIPGGTGRPSDQAGFGAIHRGRVECRRVSSLELGGGVMGEQVGRWYEGASAQGSRNG